MEKSTNLGLSLPSRNNDVDVADINVISENFSIIDEWVGDLQKEINDVSALVGGTE
jgi:hypothetical protein